jgi:hypothetical protein
LELAEVEVISRLAGLQLLFTVIPRGRIFSANKIRGRTLCGGLAVLRYWKSEGRHCPERFIRILSAEDHFGSQITSTRWLPLFEYSK